MLVLYIGKEYFPFADMWDVDHPGPPAMHKIILVYPSRIAVPTFPTVSCSDEGTIMTSLNSASSRKLTVPAILLPHAKTGRHFTMSYHWNPLGQTSPPRSSILERREYVSALLWFCVTRSLYFCYDFPTLWTKWGMNLSVLTIVWSITKPTILGARAIGRGISISVPLYHEANTPFRFTGLY